MIFDAITYTDYLRRVRKDPKNEALRSFVEFIERKLGITAIYPLSSFPFGRADLSEPYAIAQLLQEKGVIGSFARTPMPCDEPPIRLWTSVCKDPSKTMCGGISLESDKDAFTAAIAEGLERYLLNTQQDYFVAPRRETVAGIARHGAFIAPGRFAGFSKEQREKNPALRLDPEASYLWVRGTSLVTGKSVYIPAQTVASSIDPRHQPAKEPLLRAQSTIGLAVWPTREGARLAGALEAIEHDAYMIMWLNQLTVPRISLDAVRSESRSLDALIEKCERYRLKVHALRMPTDAPAYAICVALEDESGLAPRMAFGLKAHRSLAHAIEKAILEALRTRLSYRTASADEQAQHAPGTPVDKIGHSGRIFYWGHRENAKRLDFLVKGAQEERSIAAWEKDTPAEHLARIVQWCSESGYECAAVSLGTSAMNPTPWHAEMIVMPELQTTHFDESRRHEGGERIRSIPLKFGYAPRAEPFTESPHPFF